MTGFDKSPLSRGLHIGAHGGRHDWYTNPTTKQSQPVPRYHEINKNLAKFILKKLTNAKTHRH